MDKFKMELTWHNCKTCPPEENYNPYLVCTNGDKIEACTYYKKYGFQFIDDNIENYWWADLRRTIRNTKEFKEANV